MNGAEYFLSGLAILLSSFVHGLSGFGFAILAVPLLTIIVDVKSAITLSVTCSLIVTFYNFIDLRKHITLKSIRELLIGSIIGIPFGAYFLRETHAEIIKIVLGVIILCFVILSSFKLIGSKGVSNNWGYVFGLAAGICGGAVSISGPPVLIYSYMKGWDKEKLKGTFAAYLFLNGLVIQLSHVTTGLANAKTFLMFLTICPFLFIGAFVGHFFFKSMDTPLFRKIILSILTVLGLIMIVSNFN